MDAITGPVVWDSNPGFANQTAALAALMADASYYDGEDEERRSKTVKRWLIKMGACALLPAFCMLFILIRRLCRNYASHDATFEEQISEMQQRNAEICAEINSNRRGAAPADSNNNDKNDAMFWPTVRGVDEHLKRWTTEQGAVLFALFCGVAFCLSLGLHSFVYQQFTISVETLSLWTRLENAITGFSAGVVNEILKHNLYTLLWGTVREHPGWTAMGLAVTFWGTIKKSLMARKHARANVAPMLQMQEMLKVYMDALNKSDAVPSDGNREELQLPRADNPLIDAAEPVVPRRTRVKRAVL